MELVVDNGGSVKLDTGAQDGVGSSRGLSKGGDGLSNLVERELDVATVGTGHLVLGLVTQDNDAGRGRTGWLSSDQSAGGLGNRGVDTTAKTTVGRGDNVNIALVLERSSLGVLVDA